MKKIKIVLISIAHALLLSSLCLSLSAHAQSDDFNYSKAVSLILLEESGGHIFQRPDYDSPRNFFILIYGIVGKYAIQMQPQHDGLTLDLSALIIEENILLINHETQKLLFIGDHWIGDGERFAIMDSRDYSVLKGYFAQTRKHRGQPSKQSGLDKYIGKIHNLWSDDPDEFHREFYFPDPRPIPSATAQPTEMTTKNTASNTATQKAHIGNDDEAEIQSSERKNETHADAKGKSVSIKKEVKALNNNKVDSTSNNQKSQQNTAISGSLTDTYSEPKLWIFLLVAMLAIGFLWRRQSK